MEILIFDTGPLSHFARADILGVLKSVVGPRSAAIPEAVVTELEQGTHLDYRIQAVLDADWIEHRAIATTEEVAAFARFADLLVSGGHNVGETAVLALAETTPARAVIDDRVACEIASKEGVVFSRTLNLLCEAIHRELLTLDFVSEIADELIRTEYRLPFDPGGFKAWAVRENLFL